MIFIGVKVLTFFTGPNKARFARAYYMIIISKNLVIMAETSYLEFMNSKLSREVIKKNQGKPQASNFTSKLSNCIDDQQLIFFFAKVV